MIAIEGVCGRLPLLGWNLHGLLKRGHGWVGLSKTGFVQCLEINRSSWFTIVFACDNHSRTPCHWVIDIYLFQNPHFDITVQVTLYFLFPVTRDDGGSVNCLRDSIGLQSELQRRAMHEWERLMAACVKGRLSLVGNQELPELRDVSFRRPFRKWWWVRCDRANRAAAGGQFGVTRVSFRGRHGMDVCSWRVFETR